MLDSRGGTTSLAIPLNGADNDTQADEVLNEQLALVWYLYPEFETY